MGQLRIFGTHSSLGKGDTQVVWDVKEPETVEVAKERFVKELLNGATAFDVSSQSPLIVKEFDPNIEKIVIVGIAVGGRYG